MNSNWNEHCETEPLAHSGAIQPHGGLIHLTHEGIVTHASSNLSAYYGDPLALLEQPLPLTLAQVLEPTIQSLDMTPGSRSELMAVKFPNSNRLDFVLTRNQDGIVIELLHHDEKRDASPTFSVPMKTPSDTASATAMHHRIAQIVHEITGFDRVMVYAFREDGDGEVLAEARREEIYGSYLGLRFPASDIPRIARELYQKNPWRLIPYSQAAAVPLLSRRSAPSELTWSDLRSVSPIHQAYLANMGVEASLSLPILVRGELWGLVACHHAQPRVLPLKTMRAASQVARHYGLVISTWVAEVRMRFVDTLDICFAALRVSMMRQGGLISAMPEIAPTLFNQFDASGIAIRSGNVWAHLGDSPSVTALEQLAARFESTEQETMSMTDSLTRLYPDCGSLTVAGALALKLSTTDGAGLQFWLFRNELAQEVEWGGNPNKPAEFDVGAVNIAPRYSFEKWVEKRSGYSRPWTGENRLAALRLKQLLIELYG